MPIRLQKINLDGTIEIITTVPNNQPEPLTGVIQLDNGIGLYTDKLINSTDNFQFERIDGDPLIAFDTNVVDEMIQIISSSEEDNGQIFFIKV